MSTDSYLLKPHQHLEAAEELVAAVEDDNGTRTHSEAKIAILLAQTHVQIANAQMTGRQRA